MNITVDFRRPGLPEALERAVARSDNLLVDALTEIGRLGESIAKSLAPHDSGHFEDSINYSVDRHAVRIGSTSKRAHLVERGREPGRMPPPTLIASIFDIDDRQAFATARNIGLFGTPGFNVFLTTFRTLGPTVRDVTRELAAQIGELDNG